MQKELHIFICVNPLSNSIVPDIINHKNLYDYKIIEFYSKKIIKSNDSVIRFNYSTTFQMIKCYTKYKKLLKKIFNKSDINNFHVYIPHPFHIATNYLYFMDSSKITIYLMSDGVLNYYNGLPLMYVPKILIKKLTSQLILSIPYKVYYDHITALKYKKYKEFYYYFNTPMLLSGGVKKVLLNNGNGVTSDLSKIRKGHNNILIIGDAIVRNTILKRKILFFNLIDKIDPKRECTLFYKSHPSFQNNLRLKQKILGMEIVFLENILNVEKISLNYKYIISEGFSTSLLNIATMKKRYNLTHPILYVLNNNDFLNRILFKSRQNKLVKLFRSMNVEVFIDKK